MAADTSVGTASRVDVMRRSILPVRTSMAVLGSVDRLLERDIEAPVKLALLEAIFQYDPVRWFGRVAFSPAPQKWETAQADERKAAAALGAKALRGSDLPASLRAAIMAFR